MNELIDAVNNPGIEYQTIDFGGKPAFVLVPYDDFVAQQKRERWAISKSGMIPQDVVEAMMLKQHSPARAWREYLMLTQSDVAERMGVTQAALSQFERVKRLRKETREKLAAALGINAEQLLL